MLISRWTRVPFAHFRVIEHPYGWRYSVWWTSAYSGAMYRLLYIESEVYFVCPD